MAKANYYNVNGEATVLDIVKDNGATLDLGQGKTVLVAGAPVVDASKDGSPAKEGCAVKIAEPDSKPDPKK